jgi:hypothetical protein
MLRGLAMILGACLAPLTSAQGIDTLMLAEIGRFQHPYTIGTLSSSSFSCRIDRLDRPYVHMACWNLGLVTLDITDPALPVPVDTLPLATFGGLSVMSVEQRDATLYLALGAFDDDTQGTGFATVDATDPEALVLLDLWEGGGAWTSGSAIVALKDDQAFLGGMVEGVAAFDITDPSAIGYIGGFQPNPSWPGLVAYPPNARGMAIQGDVLFLCFDAGALRAIDISDPASMAQIGQYLNPQQPLFTPCAYNNIVIRDDIAFVATDFCGFEAVDISDPANMQQLSWTDPWNCQGASWFGSDGHANEVALAQGDSLLFMSAGDSELIVYDVSDPVEPQLIGGHSHPNDTAGSWGMDVHGDRVAVCLLNNTLFPFQPFYVHFGGMLLFEWEAEFTTRISTENDPALDRALEAWPNPSSSKLIVRYELDQKTPAQLRLLDIHGRTVLDRTVPGSGYLTLDLSTAAPGYYTITLTNGYEQQCTRVVRSE